MPGPRVRLVRMNGMALPRQALDAAQAGTLRLAAAAGRIAVAADRTVGVTHGWPARPTHLGKVAAPWPVGTVALSPSGRYLFLASRDGGEGQVQDLETGRVTLAIAEQNARSHSVVAGFARVRGRDVALSCRRASLLSAMDLHTGAELLTEAQFYPYPFVVQRLVAMPDGDTVAVVGYRQAEMYDALLVLSLDHLARCEAGAAQLPALTGTGLPGGMRPADDFAERVAAGSCGTDGMVLHRAPLDHEDPSDDGGPERPGEMNNFRGLYMRRLSGRGLLRAVPCDLPIATGDQVFATRGASVVATSGRVLVVPHDQETTSRSDVGEGDGRVSGGVPACRITDPLEVDAAALDAASCQVAAVLPSGDLVLFRLDHAAAAGGDRRYGAGARPDRISPPGGGPRG